MTPEFESHKNLSSHSFEDLPSPKVENSPLGTLDMQKRDRFELLSAYLDGEVTAAERRQVQEWLDTDPQVQRLYNRLLKLRQGLTTMSAPQAVPVQQTVDAVFAKLDRRRPNRALKWGGVAIAALFVGALATVLPGRDSFVPQLASSPTPNSEPLMVALNEPLVNIPKAAVTSPIKSLPHSSSNPSHDRKLH
ncbi:MAG TPA: Fis family transcriptional regulator [Cyanobacteria bacterium UBA11372]|nr:Fis family transcriptional regulator [Cyanobacteria bacterium UBA11372]